MTITAPDSAALVRAGATSDTALPSSSAIGGWTPQQTALMQFAGLAIVQENGNVILRDRGVTEAFLNICRTTGLSPFARQIYAMEVNGKLLIVVGVDGFRIIAQRSKGYAGQIGPQWATGRKVKTPMILNGAPVFDPAGNIVMEETLEWVDAWVPDALGLPRRTDKDGKDIGPARPHAARIGILRDGFSEILWQSIAWDEFGMEPRFKGDNWGTRPAHMLGIRAETHGLRRAFPNDLSGLYTPEDFDDQDAGISEEVAEEIRRTIERIGKIEDLAELTRLYHELNGVGMPDSVRATLMARAGALGADPKPQQNGQETGQGGANLPSQGTPDAGGQENAAGGRTADAPTEPDPASGADPRPDSVVRDPDDPDYEAWLNRIADPTDYDDAEPDGHGGVRSATLDAKRAERAPETPQQ